MPPKPEDLEMAKRLAERIAAAGRGRVRRVVMVGSRALGTAGPESDLDLVVLVETPRGAPAWGQKEFRAERDRLREEMGSPPVRTDLWVRTTDRFEEARRVVGGVEWMAETEGVVVYSRPLERRPVARRTPGQVRRENVSAWIEHALFALDAAARSANASVLRSDGAASGDPVSAARMAVERAVNALLVAHQLRASKSGGVAGMLALLDGVDPAMAAHLRALDAEGPGSPMAAHAIVTAIVHRLSEDAALARYLAGPSQRLARPVVFLGAG
jgi:predicted nucleotidyltransferase